MNNHEPIPVIFYHSSRHECFYGVITETDELWKMYKVLYRDTDKISYKVLVKYNNCIIMDMSYHPAKCDDKVPTT